MKEEHKVMYDQGNISIVPYESRENDRVDSEESTESLNGTLLVNNVMEFEVKSFIALDKKAEDLLSI